MLTSSVRTTPSVACQSPTSCGPTPALVGSLRSTAQRFDRRRTCSAIQGTDDPHHAAFRLLEARSPARVGRRPRRIHEAHPHISIVRELAPHSSTAYHDLLTQKLKNRDATVDVFFMDVIWVPEFAEAGWADGSTSDLLQPCVRSFSPPPSRWVDTPTISTASRVASMPGCSTTARICWPSTASHHRRPGTSSPTS
jgi:hypothetical protein